VTFDTDANQERSYGDIQNLGNGFQATFSIVDPRIAPATNCNGFPLSPQRLCLCDGFHWGGECTIQDHCLGTNRLFLSGTAEPQFLASSEGLRPETLQNIRDQYTVNPSRAYQNDLDCIYEFQVLGDEPVVELTIFYDLEEGHDYIWLESAKGETYYVLTGQQQEGEMERYYIPVDSASKSARLRMTTDSRGRRGGFYAAARAVFLNDGPNACPTGWSGTNCELRYCPPKQALRRGRVEVEGIDDSYILGRAVSQVSERSVRPMPWAPNGGCEWEFGGIASKDTVAVRLINSHFDLEPYPESAAGDKLVVRTNNFREEYEFFMEECDSDETCSQPWQVRFAIKKSAVWRSHIL
jgi:hypothetical protein